MKFQMSGARRTPKSLKTANVAMAAMVAKTVAMHARLPKERSSNADEISPGRPIATVCGASLSQSDVAPGGDLKIAPLTSQNAHSMTEYAMPHASVHQAAVPNGRSVTRMASKNATENTKLHVSEYRIMNRSRCCPEHRRRSDLS
jgi:hypothetical protein